MLDSDHCRYVCPKCRSHLVWSHTGSPGTKSRVICGNNATASRVIKNLRDVKFCQWQGTVERTKANKIIFRDEDGNLLRKNF